MSRDQLLEQLGAVKLGTGKGWKAPCPRRTHTASGTPHDGLLLSEQGPTRVAILRVGCSDECIRAGLGTAAGLFDPDQVGPFSMIELENEPPRDAPAPVSSLSSTPPNEPQELKNPGNPHPEPAAVVKPRRAELQREILRLHTQGLSYRAIGKAVGMHHTSVARLLRPAGRSER